MILFYLPRITEGASHLSPEESRHAVKVLRLKPGSEITIVDGKGGWHHAHIDEANPKQCSFKVFDKKNEPTRNFYIHIAIAPTKNIDRIEWFVEKCVEIGIDEISFLLCDNSERKVIKLERIEKKAISAMKQSLKAYIPKLNPLVSIADFTSKKQQKGQHFIAHVDFDNTRYLQKEASANSSYCVLIGPEGDFTNHEVEIALKNGYKKVSLGNSRLRTETAGIAACHILNLIN